MENKKCSHCGSNMIKKERDPILSKTFPEQPKWDWWCACKNTVGELLNGDKIWYMKWEQKNLRKLCDENNT